MPFFAAVYFLTFILLAALVMMSPLARQRLEETASSSFANDLKKWTQIMDTYECGAHAYHATMPTDALQAQFVESLNLVRSSSLLGSGLLSRSLLGSCLVGSSLRRGRVAAARPARRAASPSLGASARLGAE